MADLNVRLSMAEQVLAFSLIWVISDPVYKKADVDLALALMSGVSGHVDREHPMVGPMAAAADRLIALGGPNRATELDSWATAIFDARRAVAHFSKWRAGRAEDSFQQQRRAQRGVA